MMSNRWTVRIVGFCLLVSSSACSLNPYVEWEAPAYDASSFPAGGYPLSYALAYADAAVAAYKSKLVERETGRRLLGASLITLASAVTALAAYGADNDAILGTALLGGTAYSYARWGDVPTQDMVYAAGMDAISCATIAVLPYQIAPETNERLVQNLRDLGLAQTALKLEMAHVTAAGATDETVQAALQAAQTARAEGASALAAGAVAQNRVASAGNHLVAAVKRIDIEVYGALQASSPTLEGIKSVISGLYGATGMFAPGVDARAIYQKAIASEFGSGAPQSARALDGSAPAAPDLTALRAHTAEVHTLAAITSAIVVSLPPGAPAEGLEDCGVDVGDIIKPMTVSPSTISLTAGTAQTASIVVSGGASPYVARFLNGPATGLSLKNPLVGDRLIEVVATQEATASTYTVFVQDKDQRFAEVTVRVGTGQPGGGGGQDPVPGEINLEDLATALRNKRIVVDGHSHVISAAENEEDLVVITLAAADGAARPAIADAINAILEIQTADGRTVQARFGSRLPVSYAIGEAQAARTQPAPAKQYGAVVSALNPARIARIQTALCLGTGATDGIWGPVTQAALEKWRHRIAGGNAPVAGALAVEERDLLLEDAGRSCPLPAES